MREDSPQPGHAGDPDRPAPNAVDQDDLAHQAAHVLALFHASPVGMALLRDRVMVEVNDRLCELTGYPRGALVGQTTRLLHVSDAAYLANGQTLYPELMRTGQARTETQLRRRDGEIIEITLCLALLDTRDPARGIISSVLDVTDLRRGQALLEARFALAELSRSGDESRLIQAAAEWARRITRSGTARLHLLDAGGLEMLEQDIEDAGARAMGTAALTPLAEAARQEQVTLVHGPRAASEGEGQGWRAAVPVTHHHQVVAVLEVGGREAAYSPGDLVRLEQLGAIALDCIRTRRTTAALRAQQEGYQVAMEAARDGIWNWHLPSGEIRVNARFLTMLGYPPEPSRLTFEQWRSLLHPEDHDRLAAIVTETAGAPIKDANAMFEVEYRLRRCSGDWHWVFSRGRVIERAADGRAERVAGIHIDIDARKRAQLAARQAQQWLEDALAGGDMGLYEVDLVTGVGQVDARYLSMLGYAPGELALDVATWTQLLHPEDRERMLALVREMVEGQRDCAEAEYRLRHKSGAWRWILDRSRVYSRDAEGRAVKSGGIHLDITERKAIEERLRLAARVFESTSEGIVITDLKGHILEVNPAFVAITGYSADEVRDKTPAILRSGRHDDGFYADLWRELGAVGFWQGEIWNRRKDGEVFPEWLTISAARDERGAPTHYVGVVADISQLRESQDRLEFLAHHDPLTGLPNRLLLIDRLQLAVSRAAREARSIAVLFIDLDGFKQVNDTLGHAAGDQLLVEVAARLRARLRRGDTLGRLGGDEFLMLLEQGSDAAAAVTVAELLVELLTQPFCIDDNEVFISASIGISRFPADGEDATALLAHADQAMYQAKSSGRGGYVFYEPEMSRQATSNLSVERSLRGALRHGELFLLFQPRVALSDQRLAGLEALLRWRHPDTGVWEPRHFLTAAEHLGLTTEIWQGYLRTAIEQLTQWRAEGFAVPRLTLNCSHLELRQPGLAKTLRGLLSESGLAPHDLELELLSATLMDPSERVQRHLTALRDCGIRLTIGDVGASHAGVAGLVSAVADGFKLDQALTATLDSDPRIAAGCRCVLELGRALGIPVIADGIERESQATQLRALDCPLAQGPLFGQPLDATALRSLLLAQRVDETKP